MSSFKSSENIRKKEDGLLVGEHVHFDHTIE